MLVEAVTYRFRGHSMADPEEYRTKEEVEEWRERDPIETFAERLDRGGPARRRRRRGDRRARRSSASTRRWRSPTSPPFPPLESLYDNIYVLGDQVRGWYSVDERTPACTAARTSASVGRDGDAHELRRGGRRRTRAPATCSAPARRATSATPTRPADDAPGGRRLMAVDALPRGAQPGAARGDAARRARLPDGRGHRRLQRRLQGHRGPARGVRREARARHADLREHDRRHGRRRRDDRAAAGRRDDDGQLLAAGDGPDRQLRGARSTTCSAARRRCRWSIRMPQGAGHQLGPTHSHCLEALFLHVPGLLRRRAVHAGRREGAAQGRDPRRQPGRSSSSTRRSTASAARCPTTRTTSSTSARPRSGARATT